MKITIFSLRIMSSDVLHRLSAVTSSFCKKAIYAAGESSVGCEDKAGKDSHVNVLPEDSPVVVGISLS